MKSGVYFGPIRKSKKEERAVPVRESKVGTERQYCLIDLQFAAQVRMTFEAKWGMLPAWIHRRYRDDCAT